MYFYFQKVLLYSTFLIINGARCDIALVICFPLKFSFPPSRNVLIIRAWRGVSESLYNFEKKMGHISKKMDKRGSGLNSKHGGYAMEIETAWLSNFLLKNFAIPVLRRKTRPRVVKDRWKGLSCWLPANSYLDRHSGFHWLLILFREEYTLCEP